MGTGFVSPSVQSNQTSAHKELPGMMKSKGAVAAQKGFRQLPHGQRDRGGPKLGTDPFQMLHKMMKT